MVDDRNYFKEGKKEVVIKDMSNLSNAFVQQAYKHLLKDVVKDDDLLNILATEQNMEKFKHRIEINAEFIDNKGEMLGSVDKFNTTLLQASNDIPPSMVIVTEGSDRNDLAKYFYQMNWQNFSALKNGNVNTVRGRLTFRKGK